MLKFILSIGNNPLVMFISVLFGAAAINYINTTLIEAFYWLVPVIGVIIADLITGISAAKYRGETIRFSRGARRTMNKLVSYSCWILTCVALNQRYNTELCAWIGMGIVFLIEGISFFSNLLEPHGIKLSISAILKVIGGKLNIGDLGDIIEKDNNKNGRI